MSAASSSRSQRSKSVRFSGVSIRLKAGDGAQDLKELRLLVRANQGQAGLVVTLKKKCRYMSLGDFAVVKRQGRIVHLSADHRVGLPEVVLVVTIRAAERRHGRDGVTSATGTARTLLIAGPRWGHVAESDPRKCSDVDTDLHRRRAGQNIDGGSMFSLSSAYS